MKYKLYFLIVFILGIFIAGCSSNSKDITDLKEQVKKLQEENIVLKKQLNIPVDKEVISTAMNNAKTEDSNMISLGQTIIENNICELTLDKVEFASVVKPPRPDSFYTYYETKNPNTTYVHVITKIKNLQTTGKKADSFARVKIIYNGKYEYTSFSTIEERGGNDFTYTNITYIDPLTYGVVHFLAEVPNEVRDGTNQIDVVIIVNGVEHKYKFR